MIMYKEQFYQSREARRLRIVAEHRFFLSEEQKAQNRFSDAWNKEKKVKKACSRSGVPAEVVSDIIYTARTMARRRHEARHEVFIAASLTRARTALPYVKFAIKFVRGQGCRVLSEHNGADYPVKTFLEQVGNPQTTDDDLHNLFRDTDNEWIMQCGMFIADLTDPSHGVGGEWENCRLKPELGSFLTPMLGIFQEGAKVSAYIDGVREEEKPFIWFRSYRDESDLAGVLWEFLGEFG